MTYETLQPAMPPQLTALWDEIAAKAGVPLRRHVRPDLDAPAGCGFDGESLVLYSKEGARPFDLGRALCRLDLMVAGCPMVECLDRIEELSLAGCRHVVAEVATVIQDRLASGKMFELGFNPVLDCQARVQQELLPQFVEYYPLQHKVNAMICDLDLGLVMLRACLELRNKKLLKELVPKIRRFSKTYADKALAAADVIKDLAEFDPGTYVETVGSALAAFGFGGLTLKAVYLPTYAGPRPGQSE